MANPSSSVLSWFAIPMRMVELCAAFFKEASSQLRNAIRYSDIDVESIEPVLDAVARLRNVQAKAFEIIGRTNEQTKISGHLSFYRDAKIEEQTTVDQRIIKFLPQLIPADIRVDY